MVEPSLWTPPSEKKRLKRNSRKCPHQRIKRSSREPTGPQLEEMTETVETIAEEAADLTGPETTETTAGETTEMTETDGMEAVRGGTTIETEGLRKKVPEEFVEENVPEEFVEENVVEEDVVENVVEEGVEKEDMRRVEDSGEAEQRRYSVLTF